MVAPGHPYYNDMVDDDEDFDPRVYCQNCGHTAYDKTGEACSGCGSHNFGSTPPVLDDTPFAQDFYGEDDPRDSDDLPF